MMPGTIRINVVVAPGDSRNLHMVASSVEGDDVPVTAESATEFSLANRAESVRILDADTYEVITELALNDPRTERIDVHLGAGVDPRDVIARVEKLSSDIESHRKAKVAARTVVASEFDRRRLEDAAVERDVRRVLSSMKSKAPNVLQVGDSIPGAVEASALRWAGADDDAKRPVRAVRPPSAAVDAQGGIKPDRHLPQGASLSTWVLGRAVDGDGVLRRSPSRSADEHAIRASFGLTEAPDPAEPPAEEISTSSGSSDEVLHDLVLSKAVELVEAIGLPPDAALIVDPAETGVSGASVQQWSGGLADVAAYHDFHELVLALPDVWQQIFNPLLVDVIRELVTGLGAIESDPAIDDDTALLEVIDGARSLRTALADGPSTELGSIAFGWNPLFPLDALIDLVGDAYDAAFDPGSVPPGTGGRPTAPGSEPPRNGAGRGQRVRDHRTAETNPVRNRLLRELKQQMLANHSFTVFAADGNERAVNFGALVTWRQKWDPLSYQTGRIVSTMTLAPGETRKIVTTTKRVGKRHTEEARKGATSETNESTDTSRAESEILRGAEAATNFTLTSGGSTNLLVADGNFSTTVGANNKESGSTTRKRFRESVVKSASEYKSEVSTKVSADHEDFFEHVQTSSIENKNDEIALNAVFYELQRRYKISEELYRMRPVVLIAMPVPNPAAITVGWLIRHDWIVRRSLLDKSFLATLAYLSSSYAGDSDVLSNLASAAETHRRAVDDARIAVASSRGLTDQRSESLNALRTRLAGASDNGTLFGDLADKIFINPAGDLLGGLFGNSDNQDERERQALLLDAAEDELQRAERKAQEAQSRLQGAQSAYQQAVRDHVAAKRNASNWDVLIARLQLHVKDNILHYMQSIWAHTMPDQILLDLHDVHVPVITGSFLVEQAAAPLAFGGIGGATASEFEAIFDTAALPQGFESVPLIEIADIDELLGFKGNYAIFPMRESNAVTDLVMAPYLDEHEVLRDPLDPAANWTITSLKEYADTLRASGDFDDHRNYIEETLRDLLADSRPSEEVIVVPTDSLYVDLLPVGGSLLEPFKKAHRAIDVVKARGEARELELENLRRAARLDTGELGDPDVGDWEKQLVIDDD